jgi:hypothetical protein
MKMSATLVIPDALIQRAQRSALRQGVSVETTLLRVLETGLPDIPEALEQEFEEWEAASDEDFDRWLKSEEPEYAAR